MKRVLALAVATALLAVFGFGCAYAPPVPGFIYTDVKAGAGVGPASSAGNLKSGEACATSILGIVATGDASIGAAKKAGGINSIAYVDYTGYCILGVFAKYCTVVYGK